MAANKAQSKRGASRAAPPRPKTGTPGWLIFCAGLASGAAGLYIALPQDNLAPQPATPEPVAISAEPKNELSFEFYRKLLRIEDSASTQPEAAPVVQSPARIEPKPQPKPEPEPKPEPVQPKPVQVVEQPAPKPEPKPEPKPVEKPAPVAKGQYVLQAGSFRSRDDADGMRARLLLLGHNARIESTEVRGQTWHRVVIGPFGSELQVKSAERQLGTAGFNNLLKQQR